MTQIVLLDLYGFHRIANSCVNKVINKVRVNADVDTWLEGYTTFFILSSTEHEFYPAHKC